MHQFVLRLRDQQKLERLLSNWVQGQVTLLIVPVLGLTSNKVELGA